MRELYVRNATDVEQALAMDQGYNFVAIGIVIGKFLKSILEYGKRASLNEVHSRDHDSPFHFIYPSLCEGPVFPAGREEPGVRS